MENLKMFFLFGVLQILYPSCANIYVNVPKKQFKLLKSKYGNRPISI